MWMNRYGADWHWLGSLTMAFFALIPILLVFALIKYLMGDVALTRLQSKKIRCARHAGAALCARQN